MDEILGMFTKSYETLDLVLKFVNLVYFTISLASQITNRYVNSN